MDQPHRGEDSGPRWGDGGPFRPHGGGTLTGLGACPREGGGGERVEKSELPLSVFV